MVREPSEFVPYTKLDAKEFFSMDGIRIRGAKVEIFGGGGWVDIHLGNRERDFVAQFIYVDSSGWVYLPEYLDVNRKWSEALKQFAMQACSLVAKANLNFAVLSRDLRKLQDDCVVPGLQPNQIYIHHIKRYMFAGKFCHRKLVFDVSCGAGYGTKYISRFAKYVVGTEVNEQEINYAKKTYPGKNILFMLVPKVSETSGLPLKSADVVLCFETLEHIGFEGLEAFLDEIKRVVKDDGVVILSTPNKEIYKTQFYPPHISLMTQEEFSSLLKRHFSHIKVFPQQRPAGFLDFFEEHDIEERGEPEFCVAICGGKKQPKGFFVSIANPTIFTINWHEVFLHNLAKTGFEIYLGTYPDYLKMRSVHLSGEFKLWNESVRPIPSNVKLVKHARPDDFDVALFHEHIDLINFSSAKLPKIFVFHNAVLSLAFDLDKKAFLEKINRLKHVTFSLSYDCELLVFISEHKRATWGLQGIVIENGIDISEFLDWNGEVKEGLIVGNFLERILFHRSFLLDVTSKIPVRIIGHNKLFDSQPASNSDELKKAYSEHLVYINTTNFPFEDGFNLALMEACATGMPIITFENPTSPIENGKSGFVVKSAEEAEKYFKWLLENPDGARELGEGARNMVKSRFPIDRFLEKWRDAIFRAMKIYKAKKCMFSQPIESSKRSKNRVKVAVVAKCLIPPIGGAEHTLLEYMNILKEDFEVVGICFGLPTPYNPEPSICKGGVDIMVVGEDFERALERAKPAVVITQLDWAPQAVRWVKGHGVKSVVLVPSYEGLCFEPWRILGGLGTTKCDLKCTECEVHRRFLKRHEEFKEALTEASKVIAISEYVAEVIRRIAGIEAEVIYQPINRRYVTKAGNGDFITMVTAMPIKGIDIFLKLADLLPEERFMVVGRGSERIKAGNIKVFPHLAPSEVWRMTKLLLVPSQWPEPFGRVIPEALLSYVPVIASKVGGILEAIPSDEALVEDFTNPSAWLDKVKKSNLEKILEVGSKHSEKFLSENLKSRIKGVVQSLVL